MTRFIEVTCTNSFFFNLKNFLFNLINLFIFGLRWVFVAACRLSLVAASRGYSSLWCAGFSLWWLLLLWSTGSRHMGFSSCWDFLGGTVVKDSTIPMQWAWVRSLVRELDPICRSHGQAQIKGVEEYTLFMGETSKSHCKRGYRMGKQIQR